MTHVINGLHVSDLTTDELMDELRTMDNVTMGKLYLAMGLSIADLSGREDATRRIYEALAPMCKSDNEPEPEDDDDNETDYEFRVRTIRTLAMGKGYAYNEAHTMGLHYAKLMAEGQGDRAKRLYLSRLIG